MIDPHNYMNMVLCGREFFCERSTKDSFQRSPSLLLSFFAADKSALRNGYGTDRHLAIQESYPFTLQ